MDRKRISGPENTVTPEAKAINEININCREDNRDSEHIRPIFLKTGIISQANGSAYLEAGKTKIICSVHGPKHNPKTEQFEEKAWLLCDFKFAPYSCSTRKGYQKDPQEIEYSLRIQEALEGTLLLSNYPKTIIDVCILVLENDGSSLAHAITCASAALLDASIEMKDMVIGSSAAFINDKIVMDCTSTEQKFQNGELLLSYLPNLNEITQVSFTGNVDFHLVSEAIQWCIDATIQSSASLKNSIASS